MLLLSSDGNDDEAMDDGLLLTDPPHADKYCGISSTTPSVSLLLMLRFFLCASRKRLFSLCVPGLS
jgi:hypothetical protein